MLLFTAYKSGDRSAIENAGLPQADIINAWLTEQAETG
jgi:hypothetical protein